MATQNKQFTILSKSLQEFLSNFLVSDGCRDRDANTIRDNRIGKPEVIVKTEILTKLNCSIGDYFIFVCEDRTYSYGIEVITRFIYFLEGYDDISLKLSLKEVHIIPQPTLDKK